MSVRSSAGKDRYVAGEFDTVISPLEGWRRRGTVPPLAFLGGAAGAVESPARSSFGDPIGFDLLAALAAAGFTVCAADYGGDLFGNDTAITRVGQVKSYLQGPTWGAQDGPIILVGGSMGAGTALAYALAHPDDVAAVAMTIPLLDIQDVSFNNRNSLADDIDTAYGGAYSNAVHGPTHNPVLFADDLPADLPIAMWTASDDAICVPATADAFMAARPQTTRTDVGALGHTMAAVEASIAGIIEFCELHKP